MTCVRLEPARQPSREPPVGVSTGSPGARRRAHRLAQPACTTSSSRSTSAAGSSGACSRWCCSWRRCCSPAACRRPCSSQMGIAIIVCLSYNMLLGQGGMLSFGHAVYSGLGSFLAIHTLNLVEQGRAAAAGEPDSARRRPGGAWCSPCCWAGSPPRRRRTPFAMITLGIGELVWAMSLMFPEFFGGEGGVSGNRVDGPRAAGHHLRPADPGVLPDRGLHLRLHGADVRLHAHAAGPHAQRRARQPRARRVRRLRHAEGALHRLHHRGLLRRHLGRPGGAELRDRHLRGGRRGRARAPTCCSPSWAARPSSSAPSSAPS